MPFDVEGARGAGYSDGEIAAYLGTANKFDTAGAMKSGYTPDEIIKHLVPDAVTADEIAKSSQPARMVMAKSQQPFLAPDPSTAAMDPTGASGPPGPLETPVWKLGDANDEAKRQAGYARSNAAARATVAAQGRSFDATELQLLDEAKRNHDLYDSQPAQQLDEKGNQFAAGLVGSVGNSVHYAGLKTNNEAAKAIGDAMIQWGNDRTPDNPTFTDQVVNAIGSSASFFVPGLGVARGAKALSIIAPAAAEWLGAGAMAGLEAAGEADQVYKQNIQQGMAPEEAEKRADKTFMANMVLLPATDRMAFFNDIKSKAGRAGVAFVTEGFGQESPQQMVQNYYSDSPLTQGVADSGLIGGIAGGGQVAVQLAAHRETPALSAGEQLGHALDADTADTNFIPGAAERTAIEGMRPDTRTVDPIETVKPVLAPEVKTVEQAIAAASDVAGAPVTVPLPTTPAVGPAPTIAAAPTTRAALPSEQILQEDEPNDDQKRLVAGAVNLPGYTADEAASTATVRFGDQAAPLTAVKLTDMPSAVGGVSGQGFSREGAEAVVSLVAQTGKQVVFYQDHPSLPDGFVSPGDKNTIYLSNNPQRAGGFVAVHEVTHTAEGVKLPDGTNLHALAVQVVDKNITEAGLEILAKRHGAMVPQDATPAERRAHLINEGVADLSGWALLNENFAPKLVEEIKQRYSPEVAESVLGKFIDGLTSAINRVRNAFQSQPDLSTHIVTNLSEVHDVLAKLHAENFGSQLAKEQTKLQSMKTKSATATAAVKTAEALTPKSKRAPPPSVADIHAKADKLGVKWDNEPKFLAFTKKLTGKEHLDDLTAGQRRMVHDALVAPPDTRARARVKKEAAKLSPKKAKEVTYDDVEALADKRGIDWQRDPDFNRVMKEVTGEEHLTSLTPQQARALRDHLNKTPDISTPEGRTLSAWRELAKDDETFQTPTSHAKDFSEVMDDVAPGEFNVKGVGKQSSDFTKGIVNKWEITRRDSPNLQAANLMLRKDRALYVSLPNWKSSKSHGSRLYMAIADFAKNNNYKFIGDPMGLSDEATFRRTELMMSMALRHGGTAHIAPHPRQVNAEWDTPEADLMDHMNNAGEYGDNISVRDWATPVKWTGNQAINMLELLRSSHANVKRLVPEIADVTYNSDTHRFEGRSGEPVQLEEVLRRAQESATSRGLGHLLGRARDAKTGRVARGGVVGVATLKRAAITNTLLRAAGEGDRRSAVDTTVAELRRERVAEGVQYSPKVAFEVAPHPDDTELKARWDALPQSDKQYITDTVATDLVPRALEKFGVHGTMQQALGGWLENTNPSVSVTMADDTPHERVDLVRRALGYALVQQAVMHTSNEPFPGGKQWGVVAVDVSGLNTDGVAQLYTELRAKVLGPDGKPLINGHTTAEGTMAILVDPETADVKDISQRVADAVGDRHPVDSGGIFVTWPEKGVDHYGVQGTQEVDGGNQSEASVREAFHSLWQSATSQRDRLIEEAEARGKGEGPGQEVKQSAKEAQPPAAPRTPLSEITVKIPAIEAETGKKIVMNEKADVALRDVVDQRDKAKALLECLKS